MDTIQTPAKLPDCLLGEVTQPSESQFSETRLGYGTYGDLLSLPQICVLLYYKI